MADKKFGQFTEDTTVTGTETILVNDGGTTKYMTLNTLKTWLDGEITGTGGASVTVSTRAPINTDTTGKSEGHIWLYQGGNANLLYILDEVGASKFWRRIDAARISGWDSAPQPGYWGTNSVGTSGWYAVPTFSETSAPTITSETLAGATDTVTLSGKDALRLVLSAATTITFRGSLEPNTIHTWTVQLECAGFTPTFANIQTSPGSSINTTSGKGNFMVLTAFIQDGEELYFLNHAYTYDVPTALPSTNLIRAFPFVGSLADTEGDVTLATKTSLGGTTPSFASSSPFGLEFDGTADFLTAWGESLIEDPASGVPAASTFTSSDWTIYFEITHDGHTPDVEETVLKQGPATLGGGSTNLGLEVYVSTSNTMIAYFGGHDGSSYTSVSTTGLSVPTGRSRWKVHHDSATNLMTLERLTPTTASASANIASLDASEGHPLHVGGREYDSGDGSSDAIQRPFQGTIHSLVGYERLVTGADDTSVQTWMENTRS